MKVWTVLLASVLAFGALDAEAARRLGWTRRGRAFDSLDLFNRFLATGETAAHVEVLVRRGDLTSADGGVVRTYAPAGAPLTG